MPDSFEEARKGVGEMMFQGVTSQARKEFFDMLEKVDANLYGHHC